MHGAMPAAAVRAKGLHSTRERRDRLGDESGISQERAGLAACSKLAPKYHALYVRFAPPMDMMNRNSERQRHDDVERQACLLSSQRQRKEILHRASASRVHPEPERCEKQRSRSPTGI